MAGLWSSVRGVFLSNYSEDSLSNMFCDLSFDGSESVSKFCTYLRYLVDKDRAKACTFLISLSKATTNNGEIFFPDLVVKITFVVSIILRNDNLLVYYRDTLNIAFRSDNLVFLVEEFNRFKNRSDIIEAFGRIEIFMSDWVKDDFKRLNLFIKVRLLSRLFQKKYLFAQKTSDYWRRIIFEIIKVNNSYVFIGKFDAERLFKVFSTLWRSFSLENLMPADMSSIIAEFAYIIHQIRKGKADEVSETLNLVRALISADWFTDKVVPQSTLSPNILDRLVNYLASNLSNSLSFSQGFADIVMTLKERNVPNQVIRYVLWEFLNVILSDTKSKKSWNIIASLDDIYTGGNDQDLAIQYQGLVVEYLQRSSLDSKSVMPADYLVKLLRISNGSMVKNLVFIYFENIVPSFFTSFNEKLMDEIIQVLEAFSQAFSLENDLSMLAEEYLRPIGTLFLGVFTYGIRNNGINIKNMIVAAIGSIFRTILRSKDYVTLFLNDEMIDIYQDVAERMTDVMWNSNKILAVHVKTYGLPVILSKDIQDMLSKEEKKLKALPLLYEKVVESFVNRLNLDNTGRPGSDIDSLFEKLNESEGKSALCLAFLECYHKRIQSILSKDLFQVPKSLERGIVYLKVLRDPPNNIGSMKKVQDGYVDIFKKMHDKLSKQDVTYFDIENLKKNPLILRVSRLILDSAVQIINQIDQEFIHNLDNLFTTAAQDIEAMREIVLFLKNRHLCPDQASYDKQLQNASSDEIALRDKLNLISDVKNALHLDEETLKALKHFSKSRKFSDRFDAEKAARPLSSLEASKQIKRRTEEALKYLKRLIAVDDIHINDFNANLADAMADLKSQGQRQRQLQLELELILNYFQSTVSNVETNWNQRNERLLDAFTLLQLRDSIPSFVVALKSLHMEHVVGGARIEYVINTINDNFTVGDSQLLLRNVREAFGDLSAIEMLFISKLAAKDGLSAGRMLAFFRKNHDQQVFEGALARAQETASRNEHIAQILNKLPHIRNLLKPLWTGENLTIEILRNHLRAPNNLRINVGGKCPDVEILANVIENWTDCEVYFREKIGTSGEMNIARLVRNYQTGNFIVTNSSDSSLGQISLIYGVGDNIRFVPADQLQEHIQWAVMDSSDESIITNDLESDRSALQNFIKAYEFSNDAHKIISELEMSGHPDFQPDSNVPIKIGNTCASEDVELYLQNLEITRHTWQFNVMRGMNLCPRLNLLKMKSKVQFLLALRTVLTSENQCELLYPYVIQMFPVARFHKRSELKLTLATVISNFRNANVQQMDDWDAALCLLEMISNALVENKVIEPLEEIGINDSKVSVSCALLYGESNTSIYQIHLRRFLTDNGGPGAPSTILYCSESTSEMDIRDCLHAATCNIYPNIHIVNVDLLIPRLRNYLLSNIRTLPIKSQLLLVFGSQDGIDSFNHFNSDAIDGSPVNGSEISKYFWLSNFDAECVVVTGLSGSGKSTYINQEILRRQFSPCYFTVNEGFSFSTVLESYHQCQTESEIPGIALVFSLTVYGNLDSFQRGLHYLITYGLLIDEHTGKSMILKESMKHLIFIEMPEVDFKSSKNLFSIQDLELWRNGGWESSRHPLLRHLPIISIISHSPKFKFKMIDSNYPYILDNKSRIVGAFLRWYQSSPNDIFDNNEIQTPAQDDIAERDNDYLLAINTCFEQLGVRGSSKRVQSTIMIVLSKRCQDLQIIRDRLVIEIAEIQVTPVYYFGVMIERLENRSLKDLFCLFIKEAALANPDIDVSNEVMFRSIMPVDADATNPYTISGFEVLAIGRSKPRENEVSLYPSMRTICFENSQLPDEIRSHVAAVFGVKNSGNILPMLHDQGFVLTSESFLQLVLFHRRRETGISVISNGETGCGKSETLKLYCALINSDSTLFTNLKLHMLAIVTTAVNDLLATADEGDKPGLQEFLELRPECSAHDILEKLDHIVKYCSKEIPEVIGKAVLAYFYNLFRSFPLHLQCLPFNGRNRMAKFLSWACKPENAEESNKYLRLTRMAQDQPYLHAVGFTMAEESDEQRWRSIDVFKEYNADDDVENDNIFINDDDIVDILKQYLSCFSTSLLYHRILADSTLTATKWREFIAQICAIYKEIKELSPSSNPVICVFVDELNTSNALGMVSEAFTSRTIDGKSIDANIFFVGAINPDREVVARRNVMDFTRANIQYEEENVANDYLADIPYIVRPLNPSMRKLTANYRYLDSPGEEYFLEEYFNMNIRLPNYQNILSDKEMKEYLKIFIKQAILIIVEAQRLVREYEIPRVFISMRNMIRVVKLFFWYLTFEVEVPRADNILMIDENLREKYLSMRKFANIFLPERDTLVVRGLMGEAQQVHDYYMNDFRVRVTHSLVMSLVISYVLQLPSDALYKQGKATKDFRSSFINSICRKWSQLNDSIPIKPSPEHFKKITNDSLLHLWSYATIPRGVAKTIAMMENFYAITLASQTKFPLLITGPPGCGKTLAFNLVCENLKGESADIKLPFRQLFKAHRITYQCSATSTASEIVSRYQYACSEQKQYHAFQPGKHICLLGIDEAGLVPENRQAMKSTHDPLEEHYVCIVMMSNTTLDAAKTSRMIQLLQTQASELDLFELAWGILVEDDASTAPESFKIAWEKQIKGLCTSFVTIKDVVTRNNWFHSRDFVFLCRLLRKLILEKPSQEKRFDRDMLMTGIRRHFQTLEPYQFQGLAIHFLENCLLSCEDIDLTNQSIKYIRESLQDKLKDMNPTSAHCRYTMIVDPTESEAVLDLLFSKSYSLSLLDNQNCRVLRIADFPEDATPTKISEMLSQVKRAIESGDTLVLVNSGVLQSALYDVINRHYSIDLTMNDKNELEEHFRAQISLGSYSRMVRIHPAFKLVILVNASELPNTPLPFLNRLEKYFLSVEDTLQYQIKVISQNPPKCIRSISQEHDRIKFFESLLDGVKHFVNYVGPMATFGVNIRNTVSAVVLNSLNCENLDIFEPAASNITLALRDAQYKLTRDQESSNEESQIFDAEEDLQEFNDDNPISGHLRRIISKLNFSILEMIRPEYLLQLQDRLPATYIKEYIYHQEHFSVVRLIRILAGAVTLPKMTKLVIFTRTDDLIRRLSDVSFCRKYFGRLFHGSGGLCDIFACDRNIDEEIVNRNTPMVIFFQLSAFYSSSECEEALHSAMNGLNRVIIIVADMKICSPSTITAARSIIDSSIANLRPIWDRSILKTYGLVEYPRVIFLLHMPASYLISKPCYQSVPLNDWHYTYVDAFSDGENVVASDSSFSYSANAEPDEEVQPQVHSSQVSEWLQVIFSLQDELSEIEARNEFARLIEKSLKDAITSCQFHQQQLQLPPSTIRLIKERLPQSREVYFANNRMLVVNIFYERKYLMECLISCFSVIWGNLFRATVKDTSRKLCDGSSTRGLIECIRSTHEWLLSDFIRDLIRKHVGKYWSLEAIAKLPIEFNFDDRAEESIVLRTIHASPTSEIGIIVLTKNLLRAIAVDAVLNRDAAANTNYLSFHIDCTKYDRPSEIPLYHSLMQFLDIVRKKALSKSKSIDKPAVHQSEWDYRCFREILATERYFYLAYVVSVIESREDIFLQWQKDFISLSLNFRNHELNEIEILRKLGARFLNDDITLNEEVDESFENMHHVGIVAGPCGDVVRWFLRKHSLIKYLSEFSRLLQMMKRINLVVDDELIECDEDLIKTLMSRSVACLWRLFLRFMENQGNDGGAMSWIESMRDFTGMKLLNLKSIYERNSLSKFDISRWIFLLASYQYTVATNKIIPFQHIFSNENQHHIQFSYQEEIYRISTDDPLECFCTFLTTAPYENENDSRRHQLNCILILLQYPRVFAVSRHFSVILGSVIGHYPQPFQHIYFGSRCEILDYLLNSNELGNLTVETINQIFQVDELGKFYFPSAIMQMKFPYADNLLTNLNAPLDDKVMQLNPGHILSSEVIFRTIRLRCLSEENASEMRHIVTSLLSDYQQYKELKNSFYQKVKLSVRVIAFLDNVSRSLLVDDEILLEPKLQGIDMDWIKLAMSIAPRRLSTFLLGSLSIKSSILQSLLRNQTLLTALGMAYWLIPGNMNETEVNIDFMRKLMISQYARVIDVHYRRKYEIDSPSKLMLLNSIQEDQQIIKDAAILVQQFVSDDNISQLAAGIELPVLLETYTFMKENFSYYFLREEDAYTVTVSDALKSLPPATRAYGEKLLSQFMLSWKHLREEFGTFEICNNEVREAANIPPINNLDDIFVSNLLNMKSTQTSESYIVRMIQQRIMKNITSIFTSEYLNSMKKSDLVNFSKSVVPSIMNEENIEHFSIDQLLVGVGGSTDNRFHIDKWLRSNATWISEDDLPEFPDIERIVQYKQLLADIARDEVEVDNLRKHITDNVMNIRCPQCRNVFVDFSGCFALYCVYQGCNATFCAWCLQYCPGDAHPHVLQCPEGNKQYHGRLDQFEGHHKNKRQAAIQNIFNTLPPRKQRMLRDRLARSFAELGINVAINEVPIDAAPNPIQMPEIIAPNGRYQFDWIAVAKYIMHRYINGKVLFQERSLKEFFATDLTMIDYNPTKEVNFEFLAKDTQPQFHNRLHNLDANSANIFVRLLLASQEIVNNHAVAMTNEQIVDEQDLTNRLQRLCKYNDERILESVIADQLWCLCVEMVSLLNNSNQGNGNMTINDLVNTLIGVRKDWHSGLMREIGESHIGNLGMISMIIAQIGLEGYTHVGTDLCLELSKEDVDRFERYRNEFIDLMNSNQSPLIDERFIELQTLLGELLKLESDIIPKSKASDSIASLKGIKNFLFDEKYEYSQILIGDLQVRYFGSVLKNIRKLIGFVSYEKLRMTVDATSSNISTSANASSDSNQGNKDIYQVYITDYWLDYQEMIPSDSELANPASHFLKPKLVDDEYEYMDEYIPIHEMESDEDVEDIAAEDIKDLNESNDINQNQENPKLEDPIINLDDLKAEILRLDVDYSVAWDLIKDLDDVLASLALDCMEDMEHIEIADHIKIAANLSVENSIKYWESLYLKKEDFSMVSYHRVWIILQKKASNDDAMKQLLDNDVGLENPEELKHLENEKEQENIDKICRLLSPVEGNRFLECFHRFHPKSIDVQSVCNLLNQVRQYDIVSERYGITNDHDFCYLSDSEVIDISVSLLLVPRRKLWGLYEIKTNESLLSDLENPRIEDICRTLSNAIDRNLQLDYGIYELQDFQWLTESEVRTFIEPLKLVPQSKILCMLSHDGINDQSGRTAGNYEEAWETIMRNTPDTAQAFLSDKGVEEASDLMYLSNTMLKELSQLYKTIPRIKIQKFLLIYNP